MRTFGPTCVGRLDLHPGSLRHVGASPCPGARARDHSAQIRHLQASPKVGVRRREVPSALRRCRQPVTQPIPTPALVGAWRPPLPKSAGYFIELQEVAPGGEVQKEPSGVLMSCALEECWWRAPCTHVLLTSCVRHPRKQAGADEWRLLQRLCWRIRARRAWGGGMGSVVAQVKL